MSMNRYSEKYSSFVLEVSLKNRPIILVTYVEDSIKIIYINDEFFKLYKWGIYEPKLEKNNDFIEFCEKLLARKGDTNESEIIYLGHNRKQVDLYAVSRRTSQAKDPNPHTSDLLMIQVDCIDYQNSIRETAKIVPKYVAYTDEQINNLKAVEIKEILSYINSINKFQEQQMLINDKLLSTSRVLLSTDSFKNVSLKTVLTIVIALSSFFSSLMFSSPEKIYKLKKMNEIIEEAFIKE